MSGYPERKMWPCRDCREVGVFHCTDPERCGGTCEYVRADIVEAKDAEIERLNTALGKINAIRNSIVGAQSVNWSEHIYPLVATLSEIGIDGLPYPEAKKNIGTLIERNAELETEIERLRARNEFLEKVADQLADGVQVVTITKENQHQYSRGYRYVSEDAVVTEGVATCGVDCMPEAAAYLRERVASGDNRPPDSGVQIGVQNPEEGGKSA